MIVVIPAYEPDARLIALVDALRTTAPQAHLLVVDDGSGPASAPVFDAARQRGCVVLTHPVNRGKGAALRTGFGFVLEHAPGEDVVCADSDGQHTPADVLRVADRVAAGASLVLGVRGFTGTVPLRSRLGNSATRGLFRLATGRTVRDTQTGLRGYAASSLPWLLAVPGDRFEYEMTALLEAARQGMPIEEVPIATVYLAGNASSHFRPVVDSARVYAPLLPFLLSSLGAFGVDTAALLVVHALTGTLLLSVVTARLLSAGTNFAVNRRLVFGAGRSPLVTAARRYAALAAVLLGANYGLLTVLTGAGMSLLPAKLATELVLLAGSWLVQRHLVFRRPPRALPAAGGAPRSTRPSPAGRSAR